MFSALHDQVGSVARDAQLTRYFFAIADLLFVNTSK